MALETVKKEIIRKIKDTDEEWLLRSIQKLLDIPIPDKKIVAYTVYGEPLTKEAFIKEVLDTSDDVEAGNYISQEDLEKEVEGW